MASTAGQIINRGKNKWLLRVDLGRDEDGKRRRLNKTVHGTKKEAQAELTKMLRAKDLGVLAEPTRQSLNEYLDHWFETAAKPRLRARTYNEYQAQLDRYVRPLLGGLRLSQLSPVAIQSAYDMLNGGLSARTVRLTHAILNNALKQAVKWRMMPFNPCEAVDLPKRKRKEMYAMSEEEANRFLEVSKSDRWHVLFTLLLTAGLRPSEAIALKWTDLDLAGDRLTVQRTLSKVKGQWLFENPKTESSRRTIDIPAGTSRLLADLEPDGELVFTNGLGEPVALRSVVESHFKPLLGRADIPQKVRLYDLRHTHATLLLLAGVHPKIVSERLGHSSIQITLDTYSHVLPGMGRESATKLEAMLFSRKDEGEPLYN